MARTLEDVMNPQAQRNVNNLYGGTDSQAYRDLVRQTQAGYDKTRGMIVNNPVSQGIKSALDFAGEFVTIGGVPYKRPKPKTPPPPSESWNDPVHGYVRNCSTGEAMIWPINPDTQEFEYATEETQRPTFSHIQGQDFKGTVLPQFTMEFWVTQRVMNKQIGTEEYEDAEGNKILASYANNMEDFRNFFLAGCFPDTKFLKAGYVGAQPPYYEVSWPNLFTKTCRIVKVNPTFTLFHQDLSERIYSLKVMFKEQHFDQRIWSEDVRIHGLNGLVLG